MIFLASLLFYAGLGRCLAPSGEWDKFNFAPSSRIVTPVAIHSSHGQITNPRNLIEARGKTTFSSSGSWLALDFGIEVRAWTWCLRGYWQKLKLFHIGWRFNFVEHWFGSRWFSPRTFIHRVVPIHSPNLFRWFIIPFGKYHLRRNITGSNTFKNWIMGTALS